MKVSDSYVIELGADFEFDGAPDPKVAFGKDGRHDPATLIERSFHKLVARGGR